MQSYLWLSALGLAVGVCGTLVGAGGGFVLVPVLLILYPREKPETITSMALAVVFFNALSGSVAYARMGRIDYRSGLLFCSTSVPGAIFGALSTAMLSRQVFDMSFGALLLAVAAFLLTNVGRSTPAVSAGREGEVTCCLVERNGVSHRYTYRATYGLAISAVVGFVSSLLGIGGGIVHVPALIYVLNFPVHVATATSHFLLAVMSLAGTLAHILTGSFQHGVRRTAALSVGVIVGAQVGAWLSSRIHGAWIIRALGAALGLVALRLLFQAVPA
jgi:hypothetical protein